MHLGTLHSLKTTFLSYMSQLSIPLAARFLQGHHKPPGSAQLYSRDDVWPALRAQLLLWRAVHAGFRPARPQHRGGQAPLAEPPVLMTGFSWSAFRPTLVCFSLGEDYSAFLSLEAADADLREARTSSENAVGDAPAIPACLRRSAVTEHFEDSDGEGPGAPSQPAADELASEAPPAHRKRRPRRRQAPAHQPCHTIRFLLGPSGVAHSCISHPGSRMPCLVCSDTDCTVRCHPACGCISDVSPFSHMPAESRLCKRRACILSLSEPL